MENVRQIVNEHCNIIQQIIQEEAEHWKEIHAVLDQYVYEDFLFILKIFYVEKKFT